MSNFACRLVVACLTLFWEMVFATSPTASPSSVRNSIITIAGTGTKSSAGTGGVATAMTLNVPEGVWLSSVGTVYIVENEGHCVRKFSYPNGIVFTVAGTGSSGSAGDNGPATSAWFDYPYGIVVDTLGVVYVADHDSYKVRMVSISGIISTIAGTGIVADTGDNGPASSATLYGPMGLWSDSLYQLYVTSAEGNTVRKIGSAVNRIITRIAGTGSFDFSGDGGPATAALLYYPCSVFIDTVGVVYIGDTANKRVRTVAIGGIINTVIGTGSTTYNGDQPGTSCNLNNPFGVVVDPSNGDVYVAAYSNYLVQVLSASTAIVSVFAGNQNYEYSGESGAATSAGVTPTYLFLDTNSRLFITDILNRVRMIYPTISMSLQPSPIPSISPTENPREEPSENPSVQPSLNPNALPSSESTSALSSTGHSITVGALIGIIIGAMVGFALLAGVVWWWVRRIKSKRVLVVPEKGIMFVGETQTKNPEEKFV